MAAVRRAAAAPKPSTESGETANWQTGRRKDDETTEQEALLLGPSSCMAVAAALDVAADLDERHVVVVMAPDGATNYLRELAAERR